MASRRILILTGEPVTSAMAGPAIRAWEMAGLLGAEHEVTLATYSLQCTRSHPLATVVSVGNSELKELERWCDVVVFQGAVFEQFPWLAASNKAIVIDIYDPFHLEVLEQLRDRDEVFRSEAADFGRRALNGQLRRGDFFLCASAKQRDFWLGQLAGVGRINPQTYDADSSMTNLIDVAPFGTPVEPPVATSNVLKGVVPGIGPEDKVILWGGGVYNWFDPLTLVRAVHALHARRSQVRLFFLGMKHPNPEVAEMRTAYETRVLCDELGLTGTVVFFNEGWVAYDQRQNYLLESDVGVSTHHDHIETAFSFRTRILDYLWAGLPVVATGGDALGDLVVRENLGRAVPPEDQAALETALEEMLFDEGARDVARANVARLAPTLTWPEALSPLVRFCREPARAADLAAGPLLSERRHRSRLVSVSSAREDLAKTRRFLAEGGPRRLGEMVAKRVRRVNADRRSLD